MYAIIRTGGRQHRAEAGKMLDVDRLTNPVNESVSFNEVLLVGDGDNTIVGQPLVEGAVVTATVVEQYRAKKIIVFKYRQRTKSRVKRGHRQYYTRLRIESITV